jgi:transcriptional regulator with XRE-family HTH domain
MPDHSRLLQFFSIGFVKQLPITILLSDFPKIVKQIYWIFQRIFMENISLSGQIKLVLKSLNLTQTGLATRLGLSQGVISEFTSGSREPSKEFLIGLPKLGISLDWFLTGEGEMLLAPLPVKSGEGYKVPLLRQKVSCGSGIDWQDENNIVEYIDVFDQIPRLN